MKTKFNKTITLSVAILGIALLSTNVASAQRGNRNNSNKGANQRHAVNKKHDYNKRHQVAPYQQRGYASMPRGAQRVSHNGHNYYNHGGSYYQQVNGRYVVCNAPFGGRINRLPRGYQKVRRNGHDYYSHNGRYYAPQRDNRGNQFYLMIQF